MNAAVQYLIDVVFTLASIIFIARFLLQACRANFYNPVSQGIVKITDPVLEPFRKIIPPLGMFDISPIVVLIILYFLQENIISIYNF